MTQSAMRVLGTRVIHCVWVRRGTGGFPHRRRHYPQPKKLAHGWYAECGGTSNGSRGIGAPGQSRSSWPVWGAGDGLQGRLTALDQLFQFFLSQPDLDITRDINQLQIYLVDDRFGIFELIY
jgi:hypothetical protein